jgi:hypothetical protein
MSTTVYPLADAAKKRAWVPDAATDNATPKKTRKFSAQKWIDAITELMELGKNVHYPIYNESGGALPVGPVAIVGWYEGLGYLVNGAGFVAGDVEILVDTGTKPIVIGSTFTIAGAYLNNPTNTELMRFTSTVNLTGAGTLEFEPPLPSTIANNAIIRMDEGWKVDVAAGIPANLIITEELDDETAGYGYIFKQYTSELDTSGEAIDDPVYLQADGTIGFTRDGDLPFQQIVAYVVTLDANGVLQGIIPAPFVYNGAPIYDSTDEISIMPTDRQLMDNFGLLALHWANRELIAPNGTTVQANWAGTGLQVPSILGLNAAALTVTGKVGAANTVGNAAKLIGGAGGATNAVGGASEVTGGAGAGTGSGGQVVIQGGAAGGGGSSVKGDVSVAGPLSSPVTAAQAISANGQTITLPTTGFNKLLSSNAAYTGLIMTVGAYDGQIITLIHNTATNTLTFAASGTSKVADGVLAIIQPLTSMRLTWDATSGLWYHGN